MHYPGSKPVLLVTWAAKASRSSRTPWLWTPVDVTLLCVPDTQLHEDEGVCTYEGLPPGYNAFAFAEEEVALADAQHEKADVVFDSTFDNSDPKQAAFLASADPGK